MYAAGRIIRNRADSSLQPVSSNTVERKRKGRYYRCFVPFMWPALLMTLVGLLLIGGGVAICTAGYYLTYSTGNITDYSEITQLLSSVDNGTSTNIETKLLIYFGPILMSFGVFSIVISCVIVCETRDAIIHIMETEKLDNVVVTFSAENDNHFDDNHSTPMAAIYGP